MPVNETVDPANLFKSISKTAKQMRFATILALTRVAKNAQVEVRKSLVRDFTLRNRWTEGGIRIKPALKTDKPEPFAEVYSRDWYIAQHEQGAKRRVPKPTGAFFIPTKQFEQVLGIDADMSLIPKKYKLERVLKQRIYGNLPFKTRTRKSKQEVIAVRLPDRENRTNFSKRGGLHSTRGRRAQRDPLGILYVLEDEPVNIKGQDWFLPVVDKTYDETIEKEYDNALSFALRSAK